jgi:protein-S-isoprenylcysteine O-methyltransferase Ste14
MRIKSLLFVAVQFTCIAYLILTGRLLVAPSLIWIELAGIAVMLWAVFTVRPRHVNPFPDLHRNARLITAGPYRFVRHPMYSGLGLIATAWLLDHLTFGRIIAGLILLADLLAKAAYEESLLRQRFPEYAAYQRRTKRMIPFVY